MTPDETRLERRFRMLLGAYPAAWREHRAEEVLGVLVDSARDRGRLRPSLPDILDIVAHGLVARWMSLLLHLSQHVRGRAALLVITSVGALSTALLVLAELPWSDIPRTWISHAGPFMTTGVVVYAGWLAALLLVLAGRPRGARVTLAATVLVTLLLPVVGRLAPELPAPPLTLVALLVLFGLVGLLGTAPADRGTRVLAGVTFLGMVAGISRTVDLAGGPELYGPDLPLLPIPGFYRSDYGIEAIAHGAALGIAFALLIGGLLTLAGRPWSAAVLLATLPWAVFSLLLGEWHLTSSRILGPGPVTVALVLAAAVLMVGAGVRRCAVRFRPGGQARADAGGVPIMPHG